LSGDESGTHEVADSSEPEQYLVDAGQGGSEPVSWWHGDGLAGTFCERSRVALLATRVPGAYKDISLTEKAYEMSKLPWTDVLSLNQEW
jgi:hypothetical protein